MTKEDIASLAKRMDLMELDLANVKEHIGEMRKDIHQFKLDIREDMDNMKREIKEYIREFTGGLIKNLMWCLTLIFGVMTGILVMIVITIFGG